MSQTNRQTNRQIMGGLSRIQGAIDSELDLCDQVIKHFQAGTMISVTDSLPTERKLCIVVSKYGAQFDYPPFSRGVTHWQYYCQQDVDNLSCSL